MPKEEKINKKKVDLKTSEDTSKYTDTNKVSEAKAKLRFVRIAPRKTRLLADMIRGLPVHEAEAQLFISTKRASVCIRKLLRSATANAVQGGMNENALFVNTIQVDGGPIFKRWVPRARGAMSKIEKKTSHIVITLREKKEAKDPIFVFPKREMREGKKKKIEQNRQEAERRANETKDEKEIKSEKSDKKSVRAEKLTGKKKDSGGIKRLFRRNKV